MNGLPVRVIRRTEDGYRYDGLYRVDDFWSERGRSGFLVWRYRLFAEDVSETVVAEESKPYGPAARVSWKTQRIVRDTVQAMRIKRLYDYRCQVCGVRLEGSAGPYAEAAHIRPLGTPHNGPDIEPNLLCLCPNHHVLFDYGGFAIADDLTLIGIHGSLIVQRRHKIGVEFLRYHRDHYAMQSAD